jgi:signal transduction histidine kinase
VRPRLLTVFLLLVLAPLGAIAWLGIRSAGDEREVVSHRFARLLDGRLAAIEETIVKVVEARERDLQRITELPSYDAAAIRERVRSERIVSQLFVLDPEGGLTHPPLDAPRNAGEEAFLERTERIWSSGESFARPADGARETSAPGAPRDEARGWYTWYWGQGANFIYWKRDDEGRIVGAQVDRLLLMADIVGELPETRPGGDIDDEGRIQLLDSDGFPVYEWGQYDPPAGAHPAATRELSPPLGAWRLHYYCPPDALSEGTGAGVALTMGVSLGALALIVSALAVYFFRESGRDAREARQRVTFVNQVSHELKTPLTNIRMYAELLDDELGDADERQRRYLGVIVSESQRLSRLIGNVLSFARGQRRKLSVRPAPGRIDETVRAVVDQFLPGLRTAGFEVDLDLGADGVCSFDADALGQMVGNLISNVEKYAAGGKWIGVASRRAGDRAEILVTDRGPGIPPHQAQRVFEPFVRLSAEVVEGVSGTGIGLHIARDLARLHGGDLTLEGGERGAIFRVSIHAPFNAGGGS